MKKIEVICSILLLVGFSFKALQLPLYGDELFLLAITILSMLYFCLGFALFNDIRFGQIFKSSTYQNIGLGRIAGAIGLGLALSIILIGAGFKILVLSGAFEMLTIGLTFLAIILFIAFVVFKIKRRKPDHFYRSVFGKGLLVMIIGSIIYFVPRNSLIRFYYRNDPAHGEVLIKSIENPNDEGIRQKLEEMDEADSKHPELRNH